MRTQLQRSHHEADQASEQPIPHRSSYRKCDDVFGPLIQCDQIVAVGSPDNGRPTILPSRLSCATILQVYRHLTGEERDRARMCDIGVKDGLAVRSDGSPFDRSPPGVISGVWGGGGSQDQR